LKEHVKWYDTPRKRAKRFREFAAQEAARRQSRWRRARRHRTLCPPKWGGLEMAQIVSAQELRGRRLAAEYVRLGREL